MGTQNGSKLEIWWKGFLIHAFELKLLHFNVFPYVYMGKPCICNVLRPRSTWWAWPCVRINVTTITRFTQNFTMGACLHCVALLHFFLLSVSATAAWNKKKKKKNVHVAKIFTGWGGGLPASPGPSDTNSVRSLTNWCYCYQPFTNSPPLAGTVGECYLYLGAVSRPEHLWPSNCMESVRIWYSVFWQTSHIDQSCWETNHPSLS